MGENMKELVVQGEEENFEVVINENTIKNLIYVVRGRQVMLDSDLAELYQVETKVFNQSVKRNMERFPKEFCFQLTREEYNSLRSQFVTSKGKGGRRYLPYVFTEQGIAMLSAVLHSDVAIQISIQIMNTFVEMRHFMVSNSIILNRINELEVKQLCYQKDTDEKFGYHIGASLKDAGKKCFAINMIEDRVIIESILKRL